MLNDIVFSFEQHALNLFISNKYLLISNKGFSKLYV